MKTITLLANFISALPPWAGALMFIVLFIAASAAAELIGIAADG